MDLKIQYLRRRPLPAEIEPFSGTMDEAAELAAQKLAKGEAILARILDAETEEELQAVMRAV